MRFLARLGCLARCGHNSTSCSAYLRLCGKEWKLCANWRRGRRQPGISASELGSPRTYDRASTRPYGARKHSWGHVPRVSPPRYFPFYPPGRSPTSKEQFTGDLEARFSIVGGRGYHRFGWKSEFVQVSKLTRPEPGFSERVAPASGLTMRLKMRRGNEQDFYWPA
jgi:hypothetical protein